MPFCAMSELVFFRVLFLLRAFFATGVVGVITTVGGVREDVVGVVVCRRVGSGVAMA